MARTEPREPATWLCLVLVALLAIAVYANTLWNGFAYDDDWIILRNDRVHQLKDLGLIWGTPYWPTFGSVLGLYRPLAIFAYALEWAAADGQPWVFHAVNTLLHAGVTMLVFLLVKRLVDARAALFGAIIFAVHPVHTEAVANSVGQAELLSAIFVVGACVIYAHRRVDSPRVRWVHILPIAACYFLGLLSKEASVTLPALLMLLDVAQRRVRLERDSIKAFMGGTWMLFFIMTGVLVLYLSIRVGVLGSVSGSDAGPGLPFLREEYRVLTAFRAWPEYIRLLFFPKDLSPDYSPALILPVESLTPMALLGAAFLLLTIGLALSTPRHPQAGFVAGWFIITIITVSNLLFPVGVLVAERTLYTPSVALAAAAAFAWRAVQQQAHARERRALLGVAVVAVVLMTWRTVERNPKWKNTGTILTALVQEHPESYRAAWLMADQYFRRGDLDRSAFYWEAAMLLWPRDSQLLSEFANFNIGRKNWAKAIELLEKSRALHPWVPRTQELLAYSYLNADRSEEALATANDALKLDGWRAILLPIKAGAYEKLGKYDQAVGAWRVAVRQKGTVGWVYRAMLARALAHYGDQPGALAAADTARTLVGADTLAIRTIGELREAIRQGCYAPNGTRCRDPLEGWSVAMTPPPPLGTSPTAPQNATTPSRR